MQIPHDQLSPEALRGVVEEFVSRDGTELTHTDKKVEQVMRQLREGKAVITYDVDTAACNIVPATTIAERD